MLTRQEMFERAVRGLSSQGYRKCGMGVAEMSCEDVPACAYSSLDGKTHCAWGWVDPTLTARQTGTVNTLRTYGVGVAAELTDEDLSFACDLQSCHDCSRDPASMRQALVEFGAKHGLAWPEGVA